MQIHAQSKHKDVEECESKPHGSRYARLGADRHIQAGVHASSCPMKHKATGDVEKRQCEHIQTNVGWVRMQVQAPSKRKEVEALSWPLLCFIEEARRIMFWHFQTIEIQICYRSVPSTISGTACGSCKHIQVGVNAN